jgi:hypothetical protein
MYSPHQGRHVYRPNHVKNKISSFRSDIITLLKELSWILGRRFYKYFVPLGRIQTADLFSTPSGLRLHFRL